MMCNTGYRAHGVETLDPDNYDGLLYRPNAYLYRVDECDDEQDEMDGAE